MTHLLDTNAWLRLVQSPGEISTFAHRTLDSVSEPFGLSAISIWEVSLKLSRGRLKLVGAWPQWLDAALRSSFVRTIPLDGEMARFAAELPGNFHADPADRFIVATAMLRDLVIVTSDERILAYPNVRSLDTR